MLLFYQGYDELVQRYILPLSEYGVTYSKLRQDALKSLLVKTDKKSIDCIDKHKAIFYFSKEDILRALVNDTELFVIRTLLQWDAAQKNSSNNVDSSVNWSIVSDYYYAYYVAHLLLRLCHRGLFYFDNKSKKKLIMDVMAFTGEQVDFGNNVIFEIQLNDKDSEYSISVAEASKPTHEQVWLEINKLLKQMRDYSSDETRGKSEENMILDQILTISQDLQPYFPSALRNRVNYRAYYGVKEINKELFRADVTNETPRWLDPILKYDCRLKDDDQYQVRLFSAYTRYLQYLTFNLINDYLDRYKRKLNILSAINKNRVHTLELPKRVNTY